jgi:hypothetical protein
VLDLRSQKPELRTACAVQNKVKSGAVSDPSVWQEKKTATSVYEVLTSTCTHGRMYSSIEICW